MASRFLQNILKRIYVRRRKIAVVGGTSYILYKLNCLPRLNSTAMLPNGDVAYMYPVEWNQTIPWFETELQVGDLVRFRSPRNPETIFCRQIVAMPGGEVGSEKENNRTRVWPGHVWLQGGLKGDRISSGSERLGQIPIGLITDKICFKIWPLKEFGSPVLPDSSNDTQVKHIKYGEDQPLDIGKMLALTSHEPKDSDADSLPPKDERSNRFAFELNKEFGDGPDNNQNSSTDININDREDLTIDDLYKIVFQDNGDPKDAKTIPEECGNTMILKKDNDVVSGQKEENENCENTSFDNNIERGKVDVPNQEIFIKKVENWGEPIEIDIPVNRTDSMIVHDSKSNILESSNLINKEDRIEQGKGDVPSQEIFIKKVEHLGESIEIGIPVVRTDSMIVHNSGSNILESSSLVDKEDNIENCNSCIEENKVQKNPVNDLVKKDCASEGETEL